MKKRWLLPLIGIGVAQAALSVATPGKGMVSIVSHRGWRDSYRLAAGKTRLTVVPAIGGRIMEYSLGGKNVFLENPAEIGKVYPYQTRLWYNYGGYKTWNAPASKWTNGGWPPDPALDYGPASMEITGENSLRIVGAPSLATGLLMIKDVSLDARTGDVRIVQRIRNISDRSQEWGVWDVTQVRAPCFVVFPVNVKSRFPKGLLYMIEGSEKSRQWTVENGLCIVEYGREGAKIGSDVSEGWMVWFQDRLAYLKRFPALIEGAVYPDQDALAQVFTSGGKPDYIEMEILSPIFRLAPGEEGSLTEEWKLTLLSRPVRSRADILPALRALGLRP
ncbi:MAG: DUF4380 domain-containing protein [Armatimonadetes bacterium]|nr:DUF4380 domain-containing protein [Armatimonadota bacterium]